MTAPTTQDLEALKAAAKAATPGPWQRSGVREKWRTSYSPHMLEAHVVGPDDGRGWAALIPYDERRHAEDYATANFIALANPATILALLEERAALVRALAKAEQVIGAAASALDVADRLIERGYGVDRPGDWDAAYARVATARAKGIQRTIIWPDGSVEVEPGDSSPVATASPAERPVTGPGMPTNEPGQALAEAEGTKP